MQLKCVRLDYEDYIFLSLESPQRPEKRILDSRMCTGRSLGRISSEENNIKQIYSDDHQMSLLGKGLGVPCLIPWIAMSRKGWRDRGLTHGV